MIFGCCWYSTDLDMIRARGSWYNLLYSILCKSCNFQMKQLQKNKRWWYKIPSLIDRHHLSSVLHWCQISFPANPESSSNSYHDTISFCIRSYLCSWTTEVVFNLQLQYVQMPRDFDQNKYKMKGEWVLCRCWSDLKINKYKMFETKEWMNECSCLTLPCAMYLFYALKWVYNRLNMKLNLIFKQKESSTWKNKTCP